MMTHKELNDELLKYASQLVAIGAVINDNKVDLSDVEYAELMQVLPTESPARQEIKSRAFHLRYGRPGNTKVNLQTSLAEIEQAFLNKLLKPEIELAERQAELNNLTNRPKKVIVIGSDVGRSSLIRRLMQANEDSKYRQMPKNIPDATGAPLTNDIRVEGWLATSQPDANGDVLSEEALEAMANEHQQNGPRWVEVNYIPEEGLYVKAPLPKDPIGSVETLLRKMDSQCCKIGYVSSTPNPNEPTASASKSLTYSGYRVTEEVRSNVDEIHKVYAEVEALLKRAIPPSRELSLALTRLEESSMWATKAAVVNDEDTTPL